MLYQLLYDAKLVYLHYQPRSWREMRGTLHIEAGERG